ncbi:MULTISPECIES: ABC transporter ATP-binding protein/permease [unclassified Mesorhizobium]|uniref:ABC transporter ATP-binding protein/permease n=1 Tax=unclassified Mesorhizobium TaxID=325217 RepID=UPI00333B82FA
MRSFWGLMRVYWFSDRWREAWTLTLVIALIIALSSKADVWFTVAGAELAASIAFFHDAANTTPLKTILTNAGWLVLLVVLKDLVIAGIRNLVSKTLHRKWRGWLDSRFNEALLDSNHSHFHAQHGSSGNAAPDNIDQRVQESIKAMTGGAIGLASGVLGVFASFYFLGGELLKNSVEVKGLEFLGSYGSAVLALLAIAVYVPFNTWIALKLGRMLEWLNVRMQQAEGNYRSELITFLRRSFHVAASQGENVQKTVHSQRYADIDRTWARLNIVNTGYTSFELIYNFIGAKIVAFGPGLVPFIHNGLDLKGYLTASGQVDKLISNCSWFIHVMPEIATLRANSQRVIELAQAIENVQHPQEFYQQTGRSEFRYDHQNPVFGLTIQKLELAHQGEDATPFLSAANLRFRRGEWTFLKGESGCGKTSLIKAINGLWPYGRGTIVFPEGVRSFYAAQEVKLQQVSLKQLVCLPGSEHDYADVQVASALHKAGLGDFIEHLADESREGKIWDQVLSGGQKQKLVVARIVLQQPGLLFLDEATGALDPEGRIAFHQAIKDNCPDATVISIMHEATPPRSLAGTEFYHSVVAIADGVATKKPLVPSLPVELTTILTQPTRPAEDKWLRFPRRLKQR